MQSIGSFFGGLFGMGPSKSQINAQNDALKAQKRAAYSTEEQAARLAAEKQASGRVMAGAGRQQLAFQGNTSGPASDLGG